MGVVKIEGIEITINRKRIKNIHLRVMPPDGRVVVSSPLLVSQKRIEAFIMAKKGWIFKHRERIIKAAGVTAPRLESGETHMLFGKPLVMVIQHDGKPGNAEVINNSLYLTPGKNDSPGSRELILENWYSRRLSEILPGIVSRWEPVMGVKVRQVKVRKMKTRWGSCNPIAGRIWINLELAKRRPEIIEYIVVHEMTHLLERGHNHLFYGLMDRWLPGWRMLRKELRELPVQQL